MRSEDRKRGHSIHRERRRNVRRQRLGEERNPTLGLATRREEFALEALLALRNEEGGSTKASAATSTSIDLMIEELLDMVDREKMFAIHGDDDSVPDLGDENLKT